MLDDNTRESFHHRTVTNIHVASYSMLLSSVESRVIVSSLNLSLLVWYTCTVELEVAEHCFGSVGVVPNVFLGGGVCNPRNPTHPADPALFPDSLVPGPRSLPAFQCCTQKACNIEKLG